MSSSEYHREQHAAELRHYRKVNAVAIALQRSCKRHALKLEVMRHYTGGAIHCTMCPEHRLDALHIDHIAGGGRAHRRRLKCDGSGFYRWLKLAQYPAGYRVLCANCGCGDLDVLTVHHTTHDGAQHRRNIGAGKASYRFYCAILKSDNFTGLECLCFNCNDACGVAERVIYQESV